MLYPTLWSLSAPIITGPSASDDNWPNGHFERAFMIGIDGLGGDYLKNVTQVIAPTMKGLIDSGNCAYSFSVRDQLPTVSGPNWATILTGMPPSETGIITNAWDINYSKPASLSDGRVAPVSGAGRLPPTMFHLGKKFSKNLKTASAYGWPWIGTLSGGDVDYEKNGKMHDDTTVKFIRELILSTDKPHFTFLHMEGVDSAGHGTYWGSPVYYRALKKVDEYVGKITAAMNEAAISDNTLLVITADHGGIGNDHVKWTTATTNTPVLFCNTAGKIKSPGLIDRPIINVDYLPTIMGALGIPITPYQRGQNHDFLFKTPTSTEAPIHF